MASTTPESPKIENVEQASTNFYWTYSTNAGVFNLQTTLRGILSLGQIKAHIKMVLEATAHLAEIGGIAKQVGRGAEAVSELPSATTEIIQDAITSEPVAVSTEPQYVPVEESKPQELSFITEKIYCTNSSGRMYYKVAGGRYIKFGVTIWPEVLAQAGINAQKLEAKTYNLKDYKAVYTLNAKGNPEKVIRLEKV